MNQTEIILTNIPLINDLKMLGFNLKEICKVLNEKNNLSINYNSLKRIISLLNNNKIHLEYDNIIPLLIDYKLIPEVEKFAIKFHTVWICSKVSKINSSWRITEKNITNIPDPVALLFVKRFLRLYHISDKLLISNYLNKLRISITEKEYTKIKNISTLIKSEYNRIILEIKQKNIELILQEHIYD